MFQNQLEESWKEAWNCSKMTRQHSNQTRAREGDFAAAADYLWDLKWGKSPRMCSGMKSCLVRMPTIGGLCKQTRTRCVNEQYMKQCIYIFIFYLYRCRCRGVMQWSCRRNFELVSIQKPHAMHKMRTAEESKEYWNMFSDTLQNFFTRQHLRLR